jgi:AraC family transcriptional regulator
MTPLEEYICRINKAIDFIESNLNRQFSLEELANEAHFSKFHFSRIFYAFIRETPFQFINRVRLEKAAYFMISNPNMSLSEIAHQFGYDDLAVFSRNFKKRFDISPSKFRINKNSNNSQMHSNFNQVEIERDSYFCNIINNKNRFNMNLNKSVEVKDLPEMTVAYIRYIGPYKGDEQLFAGLWQKLFGWAGPRGLLANKDLKSLVVYHDDPNITSEDKLRMSVCISVPEETKVGGEIGKMKIEAAKYAIARFELDASQFQQAWDWVYSQWLPNSGYQPDDKACFEMYPEEPKDGKFVVDICVPVKPM